MTYSAFAPPSLPTPGTPLYKPVTRLRTLLPTLDQQLFDSQSLSQLTAKLAIMHDFPYSEKILALLPLTDTSKYLHQLVITEENLYLVDRSQEYILNQAFLFHEHVPYNQLFKQALSQVLNKQNKTYNTPMPTWRYVLMSLKASRLWAGNRIWFSPEILVENTKENDGTQVLRTLLGLSLISPVTPETLRSNLKQACLCHGLLLRMHKTRLPRNSDKLQTFLGYPSLPLVNRVLEKLEFRHIPGQREELMTCYKKLATKQAVQDFIDAEERALARRK